VCVFSSQEFLVDWWVRKRATLTLLQLSSPQKQKDICLASCSSPG
jgi:hypothetical protein